MLYYVPVGFRTINVSWQSNVQGCRIDREHRRDKRNCGTEVLVIFRVRTCLQIWRRSAKFSAVTSVDAMLKYVKFGRSNCILSPLVWFGWMSEWVCCVVVGGRNIYCHRTIRSIFRVFREEETRASCCGYVTSSSTSLKSRTFKFFIWWWNILISCKQQRKGRGGGKIESHHWDCFAHSGVQPTIRNIQLS